MATRCDDLPRGTTREAGRTALVPLLLTVFVGGLDLTVLNTALSALQSDLAPTAVQRLWIVDGYALALAALLLVSARAGDRWGRRTTLVLGLTLFGVGSVGAALATGPGWLIAARLFQGGAYAVMVASVVGSIGAVFGGRRRTVAYGLWAAAVSIGMAVGPLVGGALVTASGWQAVFWINVPVVVVAVAAALRWLPETRSARAPGWDVPGVVTSAVALGCLVHALQGAVHPGPGVALTAAVGVVSAVLFVARERRTDRPLLDLRLFADAGFSIAFGWILVGYGSYAALLYLLSLQVQQQEDLDALSAGWALVPLAAAVAAGGVVGPRLTRLADRRVLLVLAGALEAGSLAWVALASPDVRAAPLVLTGLAAGVVATLAPDLLMSASPPDTEGQAGAVQECAFALGTGLGIAVLGTVGSLAGGDGDGFVVAVLTAAGMVAVFTAAGAAAPRARVD